MKRLGLFLLAVAMVVGCAGSMAVTKKRQATYDTPTYDQVWAASLQAITEINFTIKSVEKASGVIVAEGGRNVLTQNNPPQLNVFVKEQDGKVIVDCTAMQPGQLVDYGAGNENISKFLAALNTNLGK